MRGSKVAAALQQAMYTLCAAAAASCVQFLPMCDAVFSGWCIAVLLAAVGICLTWRDSVGYRTA